MDLVRTTIRLDKDLKKKLSEVALEQERSVQSLVTEALKNYVRFERPKKNRKLIFEEVNVGPFDNLTRDDYYDDPQIDLS